MKKYIFFLMGAVCFLLSSSAVHANELNKSDANIIGHVLDKNTEEHLSFISVSLKGTTIGTMTDASGHYFLKNLPEGEFTMEVSAVGYKTVSRKVTLRKGKMQHFLCFSLFYDLPLIHDQHTVTEILHQCNIMADKQIRHLTFFLQSI